MRDTFACWLALALLFAMFFGAAVARASVGQTNVFEIVAYATIGGFATIQTVLHYRKKG